MSEFEGVIKDFLVESHENIGQLDSDLVALEKSPADTVVLGRIFRTLHTIKGSCAFLGFKKLRSIAHAGESLLGKLRDGSRVATEQMISVLLAVVDAIREMLAAIEVHGNDGNREHADLIRILEELAAGGSPGQLGSAIERPATQLSATAGFVSSGASGVTSQSPSMSPSSLAVSGIALGSVEAKPTSSDTFVLGQEQPGNDDSECDIELNLPAQPAERAKKMTGVGKPATRKETPLMQALASPSSITIGPAPAPPDSQLVEPGATPASGSVYDTTVRLDVQLLDKMMMLVSELVLARNQIAQFTVAIDDSQASEAGFAAASRHLNLITSELQEQVMKTRLQPISNIWNRFPRLVRDLVVQCDKQVSLEMDGMETELDKTIIEAIRDPLTHMVRNSIDHGIETPFVREVAGKSPTGRLVLHAFHEGGQVNIEVSDDGGGIDPQKTKLRAVERGIITSQQADDLSDQSLLNLVFIPGFSTAASVSAVSGRGVGMDVVKTNIERIGGTVDIQSRIGQGTTIRLRIPLTLAIIKALIITSGKQQYAIPQINIIELVRLDAARASKAMERFQEATVFRFRGRLLPVVQLNQVLEQVGPAGPEITEYVNLAILQAGDKLFALIVDHVNNTQEIVVKPLWHRLKSIACLAGATIMGDGRVALILDIFGLAQEAGVLQRVRERELVDARSEIPDSAQERHGFVLVEDDVRCRMAIPLDKVARLEKISRSIVERLGDQAVVQYRGEIMPLIDVAATLRKDPKAGGIPSSGETARGTGDDLLNVVVTSHNDRSVGLVVNQILDIAEQASLTKSGSTRGNVLYSSVIQGHVTEILDIDGLIRSSVPDQFVGVPAGV